MICILASGNYFSTYGGGQAYVKRLAHSLSRKGHACCVISMDYAQDSSCSESALKEDAGIPVWHLSLPTKKPLGHQPIELHETTLRALRGLLTRINPTVVHANGWKYATAAACKDLGIPCVVTAHHGGIVCPNGMLMNQHDAICAVPAAMESCLACAMHFVPGGGFWSPVVRALPERLALKTAVTLHGVRNIPYTSPAFKTPLGIRRKLNEIALLRDLPVRVIAPSPAIAAALVRNGIAQEKIALIPHGIPLPIRRPLGAAQGKRPLRFIFVGRVSHIKGVHVMLEAFSSLPPDRYELHIVGGAVTRPEKSYLGRLQREFSGVNATWHGACDQQAVVDRLAASDVMVHPAICLEVFGLTIAEALAVGRPVIASRCGGAEAQIRDEEDGWLVPPNDVAALRKAIARVIDEPELVRSMAAQLGSVTSIEDHLEELLRLYASVGETTMTEALQQT